VEGEMANPRAVQKDLPLTEASLYILLSLAPQARHGYAIMKDVRTLSKGKIELSTSTLYGALKRMLQQGWIRRAEGEAAQGDGATPGRERKAYALTRHGREVMGAEVSRIHQLGKIAQARIAESGA
jgi:DNA-binding PadR family transcriptional regulator